MLERGNRDRIGWGHLDNMSAEADVMRMTAAATLPRRHRSRRWFWRGSIERTCCVLFLRSFLLVRLFVFEGLVLFFYIHTSYFKCKRKRQVQEYTLCREADTNTKTKIGARAYFLFFLDEFVNDFERERNEILKNLLTIDTLKRRKKIRLDSSIKDSFVTSQLFFIYALSASYF